MDTTMREKVARQLELEDESRAYGSARYRSTRPLPWRTETPSTEEEVSLPPGRALAKAMIAPTAAALTEFITRVESGGAGRRHRAYPVLAQAGAEEAAYLTSRVVINSAASGLSLTATAFAVAAIIQEHVEMLLLKEKNKQGFNGLLKKSTKTTATVKRRLAIRKIMDKENCRLSVTQEEKLHIGMKCIELLCESTGFFVIDTRCGLRSSKYVRPTEAVTHWLEKQHARCELLEPIHLPMVVRPRRWRTPFWGGYLTKRPGLRLVKQWAAPYHSEVRHIHMPQVYSAINTIQEVPWRINTTILDLMTLVWDEGGSLGGLPKRDDEPLPPRPGDIDENPEARIKWFRDATAVHTRNAQTLSKRLSFQQRLWVATKFKDEEEIFFPHELDFRGRVYPIPTGGPHPQGDDAAKALIEFAEGAPLGDEGGWWLAVHIANLFGVDKVSFQDRVDWVFAHTKQIVDSAENPLDGERFWTTADSPWCALAACMDWLGWLTDKDYVSHTPVALDGSNSGLQHFSAMLRDPVGGAAVNLLPCEKPQDVYMQVAKRAQEIVDSQPTITITRKDGEGNEYTETHPNPWAGGKVTRKIAKRPTMTYCYSATRYGMVDMIHQTLREIDGDGEPHLGGFDNYQAASYLSYVIWDAISQTVVAASGAMAWLRDVAKATTKAGIPVWWTNPVGLPVLQMYCEENAKRVYVYIGGKATWVNVMVDKSIKLRAATQANAIAPNFVHSFDAAHLMSVANACHNAGIRYIAVIHDSFGTHAANAGVLSNLLRETFIDQYSPDVLSRFRDEVVAQLPPDAANDIGPPPSLGSMDLSHMFEAEYMFA
jgi:DNA-directed RNA polymerase